MTVSKAAMEGMNRGNEDGFCKYFSRRQAHFKDIYRVEYSREAAERAFGESMTTSLSDMEQVWRKEICG